MVTTSMIVEGVPVTSSPSKLNTSSETTSSFGSSKRLAVWMYTRRWKSSREALNLVLVAVNVFAAVVLCLYYRTVPRQDLLFVLGFFSYLMIYNAFYNRSRSVATNKKDVIPLTLSVWVQLSILAALLCHFVLPWVDIIINKNNRDILELVSPHTFCFSSQVLVEFWFYRESGSTIVRILTPLIFSAYRLSQAWTWLQKSMYYDNYQLALASSVFLLITSTLFFVLLLLVVPKYLKPTSKRGTSTTAQGVSAASG